KRNVKDFPLSNVDFLDLRNGANKNFEDFAAVNTFRLTMPGTDGTPERVRMAAVSINFFQMMGGSIIAGRDFQETDGTPQTTPGPGAGAGTQAASRPATAGRSPAPAPAPAPATVPAPAPAATPPPLPTMAIISNDYFQQRFG